MKDSNKDGKKISPIRKGVVIEDAINPPPLVPIPELVQVTHTLHELAKDGVLRDLAWAGVVLSDEPIWGLEGEDANYALMHTLLTHLVNASYGSRVYPALTGNYLFEEDEE